MGNKLAVESESKPKLVENAFRNLMRRVDAVQEVKNRLAAIFLSVLEPAPAQAECVEEGPPIESLGQRINEQTERLASLVQSLHDICERSQL